MHSGPMLPLQGGVNRAAGPLAARLLGPATAIAVFLSCGGGQGDTGTDPQGPASIVILPETATVDLTATLSLSATVRDSRGSSISGVTVHWTSLNPQVASVGQSGKVTGQGAGATSIIASIGNLSDTALITVRRVVTQIEVSPAAGATIVVNVSQPLIATARDAKGAVFQGAPISWATSDGQAASVSNAGVVLGIGAGAANVTASSGNAHGSVLIKVVGITPAKPQRHGEVLWTGPSFNRWSELYTPGAVWPSVQARTHVVKLYIDDIYSASTQSLQQVISTLNAAHIAVAVELGGLRDWDCSGADLARIELNGLNKLVAAGGAISFLAMDSPFGHTLSTSIPGNCGYSPQQVSDELVVYLRVVHQAMPWVSIGLIEPVPWYSVGALPPNSGNNYGDLPQILDVFLTTLAQQRERLDFFHADSPYDYDQANPDGWNKLLALQQVVRGHGLRFGLIYNSDAGGRAGDQEFHDQTLAALQAFKNVGGNPDDFIVQSWYPYPATMVPEDQPYSFTNDQKDFESLYDMLYP